MLAKLIINNKAKIFVYILLVIILVVSVFLPGPRRITIFAADATFFFDTVNRMEQGYRMYVDFNHGYGPFSFLLLWVGVKIYGINMEAFTIAQALATFILCTLSIFVTYKRFHPVFTIAIVIISWALINNPTPLGYAVNSQFSVAFWYNNLGFVLSILLLLQISSRKFSSRFHHEAVLEGVLLALLLTNKFHFLIFLSLPYVIITIRDVKFKQAWLYFGIVFISFLIISNLQFFLAQTSFIAFINQIQSIVSGSEYAGISDGDGKSFPLLHLFYFRYFITNNYYVFYAFALLVIMHVLQKEKLISWKSLFIAGAFISLLFVKISCNYHKYVLEVPFLEFIPLLYIAGKEWDFRKSSLRFALTALIILPVLIYTKDILMSHRYMVRENINLHFDYPPQDKLIMFQDSVLDKEDAPEFLQQIEEWGYSRFVYDGLALLKGMDITNKILFVCNTTDPITMHTGFNYAKGTFTWYTPPKGKDFIDYCCDEKFLQQSDLIIIPRNVANFQKIEERIQYFNTEILWQIHKNENWVLFIKISDHESIN